jgi:ActR/RegA family two-component response regulator
MEVLMERPIRVLISEDNDTWQLIFQRILGNLNYEYRLANNLDETKSQLNQCYFNLVLIDICLDPNDEGNTDGLKTMQMINEIAEGTQAIVLTAYGTVPITTTAFRDFSIFNFLEKQLFEEDYFTNTIKEAIKKSKITQTQLSLSYDALRYFRLINLDRASNLFNINKDRLQYVFKYLIRETSPIFSQYKDAQLISSKDESHIIFEYWSKAYACYCRLIVGDKNKIKVPQQSEIIVSLEEENLLCYVESIKEKSFDQFRQELVNKE